ncbi:MAG: MBL fold metallo-hydrolase [Flavobacteriales bacterium]|nr:MBL fold metallo-hydrolase [Flavobacteriales bacterium]
MKGLNITALGQTGYLMEYANTRILIDPYLSEYVADKYGVHLKRMSPSAISPAELMDIDIILITHAHEDHCDPLTLNALILNNPSARIFGSYNCLDILKENDIDTTSFHVSDDASGVKTGDTDISIVALPSAHTKLEYNEHGNSKFLGYLIRFGDIVLYHAGDTIPHEIITERLSTKTIDWAFLPINEQNHFRDREGIIGNMSPKEALLWAKELRVKNLIPTHWDTFEPNSTDPDELNLLYEKGQYDFNLKWLEIDKSISINLL